MEKKWSLDSLYKGLNSDEFQRDFTNFRKKCDEVCAWCESNLTSSANPKEKLETYINLSNEIGYYGMMGTYCQLLGAVDSANYEALKYLEKLDEIATDLVKPDTMFISFVKNIENIEEIIESSPILKEHSFYLEEVKEQAQYVLSEEVETAISKMKNTASNAWSNLHDQITSFHTVNVDGKEIPLSEARNMAYEADLELRKKAYEAEVESFRKIDLSAAACLNAIKGEVITEAKMRGYSSPLDMTLKNSRLEANALEAMFSAIDDYLPEIRKYFLRKAEILGDKNGLKYYNLFAPVGEVSINLTYEDAAKFVIDTFGNFSKDMGDFARNAFDSGWLDVEPAKGKSGGAFCAPIHQIKESRILSNFMAGSFESLLTLAHELGHGYHNHCLKDETYLNSDYPMPIAETASTFCETIVCKSAMKDMSDISKLAVLENEISGAAQVVVDIYARYLFETSLFEERKNGSLSADELSALMVDAQKKAYGEGLDEATIHPYMWIVKGHYYDAGVNFYNFPYAYGHLFCLGLYSKYLEEGPTFAQTYKEILASTSTRNLSEIGKLCGIDTGDIGFWKSSLELIKKDVDEYMELSKILVGK